MPMHECKRFENRAGIVLLLIVILIRTFAKVTFLYFLELFLNKDVLWKMTSARLQLLHVCHCIQGNFLWQYESYMGHFASNSFADAKAAHPY